jgi:hypothetical protein
VQVSTFHKNTKSVQFVVADAGVGIPSTLKEGRPEIHSDTEALDQCYSGRCDSRYKPRTGKWAVWNIPRMQQVKWLFSS